MAAGQVFLGVSLLPLQDAESTQPTWGQAFRQGVEAFFTVERVRDTIIILIAAGFYYWLARHAKDKMILTPSRVVVAQELHGLTRVGMTHADLATAITMLDSASKNPQDQEEAILAGLALRRDLAAEATEKQLAGLTGPALVSAAGPVESSLGASAKAYLTKTSLTTAEELDLRKSVARASHDTADKTWRETRLALRRIRKSQSLGVAGLLLIVLVVILFGNPAIVAFGVLGAVVSRTVAFFRESTDTDQKYNWVILFLVPIVGGLSAYGGVLLIDAMRTWGLLGDAFTGVDFGGEHASTPTLAAAFLFGFVERLLDNVSSKAADGLGAVMAKENESGAIDKTAPSASASTVSTSGNPAGGGPGGAAPPEEAENESQLVPEAEGDKPADGQPAQGTQPQEESPAPASTTTASIGTLIGAVVEDVLATMRSALAPRDQEASMAEDASTASSTTQPGAAGPAADSPAAPAPTRVHTAPGPSASEVPMEMAEPVTTEAEGHYQPDSETRSDERRPEDERDPQSH